MAAITTPGPKECKPGVPVGSPDCQVQPCEFNAELKSDDINCVAPTQPAALVNTGPSSIIGAAATIGIGGAAMRYMWLRRKLSL